MITKLIFKYGFISEQKSIEYLCKRYKYFSNFTQEPYTLLKSVYDDRLLYLSTQERKDVSKFELLHPDRLISLIENDFPNFIFIFLFWESQKFRNFVFRNEKNCESASEMIFNIVSNKNPESIKKPLTLLNISTKIYSKKFYELLNNIPNDN